MNEQQPDLPGIDVPVDKLAVLTRLATALEEKILDYSRREQELKTLGDEIKNLSETVIPGIMVELNLKSLTLGSGAVIDRKKEYFASIPKEKTAAAMAWLRANNMGAVIKSEAVVDGSLKDRLEATGLPFSLKETVHPQTLKALVTEQCETNGDNFPKDTFNVFEVERARIKRGR